MQLGTGSYSPGRGEGAIQQGLQQRSDILQVILLSRSHHSNAVGGESVQRGPSLAVFARTEQKLSCKQLQERPV